LAFVYPLAAVMAVGELAKPIGSALAPALRQDLRRRVFSALPLGP
jgi:hypothetical protein